jgi:transposase-like protein
MNLVKKQDITKVFRFHVEKAVNSLLAAGIQEGGSKEVLPYAIVPTESAFVWKELLQGQAKSFCVISDGLKGITDSIFYVHPQVSLRFLYDFTSSYSLYYDIDDSAFWHVYCMY